MYIGMIICSFSPPSKLNFLDGNYKKQMLNIMVALLYSDSLLGHCVVAHLTVSSVFQTSLMTQSLKRFVDAKFLKIGLDR
jgi:hypothetical protein